MTSTKGRSGLLLVGLVVLALTSCGRPPDTAPRDRALELPGFRPGPVSGLSLDQVAANALDPDALMGFLEENGFTGATVQAHSAGAGVGVRTVRIEVISFDGTAGADAYLTWLERHAEEFIGPVTLGSIRDLPVAFVLLHEPSGCCLKEQQVWVTAWRSGTDAIWIRVIGPDVRPGSVARLVERLQAAL